jgi:hypothetical protein
MPLPKTNPVLEGVRWKYVRLSMYAIMARFVDLA